MRVKNLFRFFVAGFICLTSLSSCNEAAKSPYEPITFNRLSKIPGVGRSAAVSFVIGNKAYVALGRNSDRSGQLNDCWEYNPDSDKWTRKADFPGKARVKAAAIAINGKAYVGLGFDLNYPVYAKQDSSYLRDFWEYDPENNSWTRKADFPSYATDACVTYVYNNEIYFAAGFNGYGFMNECWQYNPGTDKWTRMPDFKVYPRFGGVVCSDSTHIYYGTGYRTYNENDWWVFQPANGSWRQLREMPDDGRENAVSLTIGKRFFVMTGKHFAGTLTGGRTLSNVMEYDAIRDVWYNRGNVPGKGRANAVAFTINGTGYIGFGDNDSTVINDFWSFKP